MRKHLLANRIDVVLRLLAAANFLIVVQPHGVGKSAVRASSARLPYESEEAHKNNNVT